MSVALDDLCTIADLKAWLPNQGNNDDATLQSLISNGSLQILRYLDRPHLLASVLATLNETYDGNDSDRLLPHNYPILGVTGISVDGLAIPQAITPTAAGFIFDSRRVLLRYYQFTRGVQNVQITYAAGYNTIPLDLKQAAIESFALAYRQRSHIGEKSNSMGGQVTISFDMSDAPPRAMKILDLYRRVAL